MASEKMDSQEKDLALSLLEEGTSITEVARLSGRSVSTISRLKAQYCSSTRMATRVLRAGAEKLALKVLKHATVEEAIEVFSRPNIGVLDPIQQKPTAPSVFIAVNPGNLGGVIASPVPQAALPEPKQEVIEAKVEEVKPVSRPRSRKVVPISGFAELPGA